MMFSSTRLLALAAVVGYAAASTCVVKSMYKVIPNDTLTKIAAAYGVTLAQIAAVNPGITDLNYIQVDQLVNIPNTDCVPATTTNVSCKATRGYIVQTGDYLSKIAAANGLTLAQIVAANPQISNIDLIQVGEVVAIPASTCVPSTLKARQDLATCSTIGDGTYTVVSGDGFYNIAVSFGITQDALAAANPQVTDVNLIYVGQVLNIPLCSTATITSSATRASATTSATCVPTVAYTYTVIAGDTLYKISVAQGVTLEALISVNPQIANIDAIEPGDIVNIPSCSPPVTSTAPAPTATATCTSGNATYTIQTGDTLTKIAAAKGITLASLEAANPQITDVDLIFAGQVLNIPLCDSSATATTTASTDCAAAGSASTYTVVSGDTTTAIAAKFGISLSALLAANPDITDPDLIYVDQVINIPVCSSFVTPASATASATATPTANTDCAAAGSASTYTVVSGDTTTAIAAKFGISLAALLAANPDITDADLIYVGEVITIPVCGTSSSGDTTTTTTTTTSARDCIPVGEADLTYTVKSGDTMSAIAATYNVTLAALEAANPQVTDVDLIDVGQVLYLPLCGYVFVLDNSACAPVSKKSAMRGMGFVA